MSDCYLDIFCPELLEHTEVVEFYDFVGPVEPVIDKKNIVVSCIVDPNRALDVFFWGDYFEYRYNDLNFNQIQTEILHQRIWQFLNNGIGVFFINPQRVNFDRSLIQHPKFCYIELPEFYGTYWDFYSRVADPVNFSNSVEHYFLALAKRPTPSRLFIFNHLYRLPVPSCLSYLCELQVENKILDIGNARAWRSGLRKTLEFWPELKSQFEELESLIPYQSHPDLMTVADSFGYSGGWTMNPTLYNTSFVEIVTETYTYQHYDQVYTEKIFKPIWHLRPFILAGGQGGLSNLRALGFETFSPWFDESYDLEPDFTARMNLIGEEISRISRLSLAECSKILADMRPVLEHNLAHLSKLSQRLASQKHTLRLFFQRKILDGHNDRH